MRAQHTETPWEWKQTRGNNCFEHLIYGGRKIVAALDGEINENVKANAEFIVKACNAHDEMLTFIEKVAEWPYTAQHRAQSIFEAQAEAFVLIKKVRS